MNTWGFGDFATLAFSGVAAVAGSLALLFLRQIINRLDKQDLALYGNAETGAKGLLSRMDLLEYQLKFWRPYRRGDDPMAAPPTGK
jgi:hypothetical protein